MFFLRGASGSGESASLPGLRAALPKMDWRDFDEFGVPSPCPPEWRPLTTERWIQVAVENKRRGKDTGIVGGAIMGEILACPSALRYRRACWKVRNVPILAEPISFAAGT
jgi:hypothetical protein